MNDDELDRLVQGLPRASMPDPDVEARMWRQIEPRVHSASRGRLIPWAAAAALLLSVGSVFAVPSQVSPLAPTLTALPLPAHDDGLLPAEADLQAAVRDLESAYATRRSALEPDVLAVLDENLAMVGAAVAQSRAALAERPGDPHLQHMLRLAYGQQLDLLTRATGVHR